MDRGKIQNIFNDDDDDDDNNNNNENEDDDDDDSEDDDDGDGDNGCDVGRGVSLVKKRKKHASIFKGDNSKKNKNLELH